LSRSDLPTNGCLADVAGGMLSATKRTFTAPKSGAMLKGACNRLASGAPNERGSLLEVIHI